MEKRIALLIFFFILNTLAAFSLPLSIFMDEGQYLLVAKKMLDGWVPYRDIIENKPLGMYLALIPAVILCGKDIVRIRLYAALIVTITSFLVYLIGEKIGKKWTGLFSALIFIYVQVFPSLYGYYLISEPLVNLFVVAIFYIMLCKGIDYRNIFLIGVLAAAACSVRQTSVAVFIPIAFVLLQSGKLSDKRILALFFLGLAVVAVPMVIYLAANSALYNAVYWCFFKVAESGIAIPETMLATFYEFAFIVYPLIILALLSLFNRRVENKILWLWLLSFFVILQFSYTLSHNYLLISPPLSILAAEGYRQMPRIKRIGAKWNKIVANGLRVALGLGILLLVFSEFVLICDFRNLYGTYPYVTWEDQKAVSEFISTHTNESDVIFVFKHDSEVYYLSDRNPAGRMTFFPVAYTATMSNEEMNEFIFEPLEKYKPKYFVTNYAEFEILYSGERVSIEVERYIDNKYDYVTGYGPLRIYERKETV